MPYRLRHSVLPLVCVLLCVLCPPLSGQTTRPAENIALLDSLAGMFSASLVRDLDPDGFAGFRLAFSDHPAAGRLRRLYPAPGATATAQTPGSPLIHYYIADFGVRYFPYDNDADSLVREASLRLHANTESPLQKELPAYSLQLRDTIARADIPFVESNQFDFGRAPIPAPPSDFYSDIAEPLIVVSAAIITVLLLFTVRSQ